MAARMSLDALEHLERQVRDALEANDLGLIASLLSDQQPADIADLVEQLSEEERLKIFEQLPLERAADVLSEMNSHTTRELVSTLEPEHVGNLLDQLPMDEAAEILTEDVPDLQQELLSEMEPQEAASVRDLLQYPLQSAGRIMTERFVSVTASMTAAQVIMHLRRVASDVEMVNDIYVLNGGKRLEGVVSLRSVITAPQNAVVGNFMTTDVITVSPETDREEVARLVARYDFLAMPVVAPNGRLLGIITVDDVIDVLVEEMNEDAMRFGGIEGGGSLDQPYFTIPILHVIRKRIGWLLLLFLAETLTGSVLRLFESELAQVVALSFFIPLLIGTGGNTGAQTVSTIIRGLALKEIKLRDTGRVLARELGSGVLLGLGLGTVGIVRTLLWGSEFRFALVIGLTILAICAWANTIGSLIPLVAQRLKIDPAVVSAPLITTLVDATGLAIYFLIAKVLLGL